MCRLAARLTTFLGPSQSEQTPPDGNASLSPARTGLDQRADVKMAGSTVGRTVVGGLKGSRPHQPVSCEYEIVEAAGGALTLTCSPQLESRSVSWSPAASDAVSLIGKAAPTAEIVRVSEVFGVELVAATVHVRR